MNFLMTRIWVGLILVLSVGLQGCTLIQTTYNQAPDLMSWWLDGFVDMNRLQKEVISEDLNQIQLWHRGTQLPLYLETIRALDSKVALDLTVEDICRPLEQSIEIKARDLLIAFEPLFIHLVMNMQIEQLKTLQRKYDKNNKEWRHDWLEASVQDRLALRVKKDREIGEWLYGRLSAEQMELLKELVLESPFDASKTYAERLRKQADSIETLKGLILERPNPNETQQTVHLLLLRSTLESPDQSFKEYYYKNLRSQCPRAVKFHNSTTQKQRQRALKTLQSLELDILELSKKKITATHERLYEPDQALQFRGV